MTLPSVDTSCSHKETPLHYLPRLVAAVNVSDGKDARKVLLVVEFCHSFLWSPGLNYIAHKALCACIYLHYNIWINFKSNSFMVHICATALQLSDSCHRIISSLYKDPFYFKAEETLLL